MSEPMSRDELVARILAIDHVGDHVKCTVCGCDKNPINRMPVDYTVCMPEYCSGYHDSPYAQLLYPGERASESGAADSWFDRADELWQLIRELRERGEDGTVDQKETDR